MKEKIEALESRYSFQEDLLEQLNSVVIEQQKQLDTQARQLQLLHKQIEELRESVQSREPGPDSERPPHY